MLRLCALLILVHGGMAAYVAVTPRACRPQQRLPARCAVPRAVAGADPYDVLGIGRDATAAQIKQAYRKLALRSHPDVNKEPDAEATFQRIADAYATLSDAKARAKYDRSGAGAWRAAGGSSAGRSASSTSAGARAWDDFDPSDPVGWATSAASRNPAAAAAAAEAQRRWREANPRPDELGDSFGSLLNDVVAGIGNVVAGSGDWLSLLDELALTEGPELQTLLRSRDSAALEEELENTRWVQKTLAARIERLRTEAEAAEAEVSAFRKEGFRSGGGGSDGGSMAKSYERELARDLRRRNERVADAKRLLTQAQSREVRISRRLDEIKNGGGGSGAKGGPPRQLASVDDELERLKRELGRAPPAPASPPPAPASPPSPPPASSARSGATAGGTAGGAGGVQEPSAMKAGAIKEELRGLGVDPSGLLEKETLVEALVRARARAN